MADENKIEILRKKIYEEILLAFKIPRNNFSRKLFSPLFNKPAVKFSRIGAALDSDLKEFGVRRAAELMLRNFADKVTSIGEDRVPKEGPLLVVSNHPGTIDSIAIAASLPRNDLKIVGQDIPFLMELPHVSKHMIWTRAREHIQSRAGVIRQAINHLKEGGSVLIYPSGQIDPDPLVLPKAREAIENWSRSIALMIRKVPDTNVQVTIVSGVLEKKFAHSRLTKIHKEALPQRRMAEFMQVLQQLYRDWRLSDTNISFAEPILCSLFDNVRDTKEVLDRIKHQAFELYDEHMAFFGPPLLPANIE